MAEKETGRDDQWDDLLPEAVQRLWEEIKAKMSPDDPICAHCVNMVWPIKIEPERPLERWRIRYPVCPCHPDSPGTPREVDPCGSCANFRPKPKPAVRGVPPEPRRPTDKFIPLTRGLWAVVDAVDFERLSQYCWYASPSGGGKMYARRNTKTGTILMHREIMHTPKGMEVDHKDLDGLNNRQDNLRNCTRGQNEYNKGPHGDKWQAKLKHKGVTYLPGTFDDEIEAAKARDRKAYELEGEFAYLNFPEEIRAEFAQRRTPGAAEDTGHTVKETGP